MKLSTRLNELEHQLIVSCQASPDSPFRHTDIICAFARAAVQNGAAALRIESLDDIRAVRAREQVLLIGLVKRRDLEVFITPTEQDVTDVCLAGADIVAFDATQRPRQSTVRRLVEVCHAQGKWAMADISTLEEGQAAWQAGADLVGTTLSGYTPYSRMGNGPDFALIRGLAEAGITTVAEGHITSPSQARQALDCGAFAVVVGSAITRPDVITRWYAQALHPGLEP